MAAMIKLYKSKDENGLEVQHVIYRVGASYQVFRWDEVTDGSRLVETFEFDDSNQKDRMDALAMAKGNAKSRSDNIELD